VLAQLNFLPEDDLKMETCREVSQCEYTLRRNSVYCLIKQMQLFSDYAVPG